MDGLINADNFTTADELLQAVEDAFKNGNELTTVTKGSRIVGSMLSPEATHRALASKVAEQWIAHPEILGDLATSMEETGEDWND